MLLGLPRWVAVSCLIVRAAFAVLPIVTSILTIGVVVSAVLSWKNGWWTRFRRIHYSLFTLLAVGYVWFYWYWNVLGFQY